MRTVVIVLAFLFSIPAFCQLPAADSAFYARGVDSLIQVSFAFSRKNDFVKAYETHNAAEKIALENFGTASAAYGSCCNNRGSILHFKSEFLEAEKWYLESKAIREKVLGKEHPDYVKCLNTLGILYKDMGQYEKSEKLYFEGIDIEDKVRGKENHIYARFLQNLANLYLAMENYLKAEQFYLESTAILKKVLGMEHPEYARFINNLSNFYSIIGNFEKAEKFCLEALVIREKVLGMEHPDYAKSLMVLGNIYEAMGNYKKAESLQLEAKTIWEKTLGKETYDYALCVKDLAIVYVDMGNYNKAEELYMEANTIFEKTIGKENPLFLGGLINLGEAYWRMGNFEKAEPLFLEAKEIFEARLNNRTHRYYTICLNYLGTLYKEQKNYQKAEQLYVEVKNIREETLGKEHRYYANSLKNLATLYETQGRFNESEPLLEEYLTLTKANISKSTTFLSEREISNFTATFKENEDDISSFMLNRQAKNEREGILPALDFNLSLFQKGFLLSSAVRLNNLSKSVPEAEETSQRLKGYRHRLTAEYAKPIAKRNNVAELEEKANAAEKELARMVAGYTEANQQANWQEVQSALRPHEAAIEFIRFQVNFPKKTDSTMYAALVLLPAEASAKEGLHGDRQPEFIPLFEEKSLDSILVSSAARKADYVNAVYGFKTETNNPRAQKSLYELLWKPLENNLAGTRTIYFSPSGLLHRLNLNAIPINNKETLSDRYHLVEMGSTKQLRISSESKISTTDSGQALLFGGVQYDLNSDSIASQNIDIESSITGARGDLNFSYTDSTDRGGTWNYLKWTEKEVTTLEPILQSAQIQTTVRKGYTATEEALKSIGSTGTRSPRILHIATHGYFFPDPKESTKGSASGLGTEPVFKLSDHPMIRSGLILAGGNHAWKSGKPYREGMEDGILTAYEISQMDLSNTELVVLSACETGLGDIQGNEGVYGLQRAFKIAGAKYLIMSLWQVPDFQTQELMTTFYTNWLPSAAEAMAGKTEKQPIPDAFRAAQQAMREKYEHPYFWAGFVLVE